MADQLDHRRGREANERRIYEQMQRINSGPGGGQLSDARLREIARERATRAAEQAVRDEKK